MIRSLFILFLILMQHSAYAQCKYEWTLGSGIDCVSQTMNSSEEIPGSCSRVFRKKFLDSIVMDMESNPVSYPRGREYPGEISDFRMYYYEGIQVVHYKSIKHFFEGDTVRLHDISFTDRKDWSEHGCYHILYHPEWGIIRRYLIARDPIFDESYLASNS